MTPYKPAIHGYYCEDGYLVQLNGEEIYRAGNHRQESSYSSRADPGSDMAQTIGTIRRYCALTARDLARERGAYYCGITRTRNLEDLP